MKAFAVLLFAVLLAGCATAPGRQVSNFAYTKPEQAVSIPAPTQMSQDGVKSVTIFTAILDAGVWGTEGVNGAGVWPVLALENGEVYRGYVFVTDLNWWGDFILEACIAGHISAQAKILYLNRDGGWVYDLTGKEVDYIPKKFDEDKSYQAQIFASAGTTLSELDSFWRMYSEKRGVAVKTGAVFYREIAVGSSEWEAYKVSLSERMAHKYQMPDGKTRESFMPLEDFRKAASQNYGLTPGQRFRKGLNIPVAIDPISAGAGVAGAILNGVLAANTTSWTGFYARADALRKDLKPQFRLMQRLYKQLLMQRDTVIYQMQQRLRGRSES